MKFFKDLFYTFLICSICVNLQAQEAEQTQTINDGSIGEQFEFAINKSNNYNDAKGRAYEVIRRTMLLNLKTNAVDSLNAVKAKLKSTSSIVSAQEKEINTLKTTLSETQNTLTATNEEKDSMSFFGKLMSKTAYNVLMWSIIGTLLGLLLFFIFRFKNSNAITKSAKNMQAKLENELKEQKRVSLEREQKIKRQLQDEINKNLG